MNHTTIGCLEIARRAFDDGKSPTEGLDRLKTYLADAQFPLQERLSEKGRPLQLVRATMLD